MYRELENVKIDATVPCDEKLDQETDVVIDINKPTDNRSFAHGINFYKLVWIFIIGCVIGVIMETALCFAKTGTIESRQGLIYGPFSPVYGFGAVLFTVILYKIRNISSAFIFLISAIIGGLFEFICSWVEEVLFGAISWEYSNLPLNLYGRTNLLYSMYWGLLGMVFIKHIYPFMSRQIEKIPNKIGIILTWVFLIFMVFDIFISSCAVKRQSERDYGMPAKNAFEQFLDYEYPDEYLKNIYPNMIIL